MVYVCHIPITFRRILRYCVRFFLKSTLHLYNPASLFWMLKMVSALGLERGRERKKKVIELVDNLSLIVLLI